MLHLLGFVEDLVASQDVVVSNGKGKDMSEEFLAAIGHDKNLVSQSAVSDLYRRAQDQLYCSEYLPVFRSQLPGEPVSSV